MDKVLNKIFWRHAEQRWEDDGKKGKEVSTYQQHRAANWLTNQDALLGSTLQHKIVRSNKANITEAESSK